MAETPPAGSGGSGPVEGTATGPKFIFGRLNKNWRDARGGDTDAIKQVVGELSDSLRKQLGRKPTPREVQDAYRSQILARVRGVILAKMTEQAGKPPTPDEFRDAMDRWRTNNLLDAMELVNKELGTKGTGLPGNRVVAPRRRGWQQRTQASIDKAMNAPRFRAQRERAAEQLEALPTPPQAQAGKASTELPLTGHRATAFRMGDRLAPRLEAFLAEQREEIVQRVTRNAEQIKNKPGDLSVWWDEKKWKAELEKLLVPYATVLADFAADAAGERLEQPAASGKARLDPVQPAGEPLVSEQPAAQISVPIYLQQQPVDIEPFADALRDNTAVMKAALDREPTVINVPPPVINLPAPIVYMEPPVVNVEAAVIPAPIVNVEAPAEKAAMEGPMDVRVISLPERKMTSVKRVKRDKQGLITEVLESAIDE